MKRLAVSLLALALLVAPLAAGAQPAGRVPHIAIVFGVPPVSQMLGPDPGYPPSGPSSRSCVPWGTWTGRTS
jgi:hypothetical protein